MGSYELQRKQGFYSEYESKTMEGFEQEREKPDLHILKQPLVRDRPLLLSSWLWGTCFWGPTKSLKEKIPQGTAGQE